jgi:hypothetical protein
MATPKRARATSSTPRSKKSAATSAQETTTLQHSQNGNVEEAVRVRAYQLFEQRGRTHGHDVEDWFRAVAEISTTAQHSA